MNLKFTLFGIISLMMVGCSIRMPPIDIYVKAQPPCPSDKSFFSYNQGQGKVGINLTEVTTETHKLWKLSFPSAVPYWNAQVHVVADYWQYKWGNKHGLIIVVPIVDGPKYPSEHITEVFTTWPGESKRRRPAKYNFHVIKLGWSQEVFNPLRFKSLKSEEQVLKEMLRVRDKLRGLLVDIRRVLDWAESQQEIDSTRIGVAGGSLGAVIASSTMGIDSRISAGFFIGGGGLLYQLFGQSRAWILSTIREAVLENLSWTQEYYQNKIKPFLEPVDPVTWAGCVNPRGVLLVDAVEPNTRPPFVPWQSSQALWQAMGYPKRLIIYSGHKMAFALGMSPLGLYFADAKMLKHFAEQLNQTK